MTKKLFIVLFYVFFCAIGYTQSRLSYSIDIAPIYSFRDYTIDKYSKATDIFHSGKRIFNQAEEFYKENEKSSFGFGFSIGVNYNISDKIIIRSGLGYKTIKEKLTFLTPPNYSNRMELHYSSESEITNQLNYLSLPIDFQYKLFKSNKISLGLVIGPDFDLLLSYNLKHYTVINSDNLKFDSPQVSNIAVNIKCGFLLDYQFHNNFSFFFQPEFAKYITPNIRYDIQHSDNYYCQINRYDYYIQGRFGLKFIPNVNH
jgi:hypothetical protein